MELVKALRIGSNTRLAFTGAGGKTTALFQTAQQLWRRGEVQRVLVTASTHLAQEQLSLAHHHYSVQTTSDLEDILTNLPKGINLLTGPPDIEERVSGLSLQLLDIIHDFAQKNKYPVLIEADGSRQRPLKAPEGHEPVVPLWVSKVVVLAGLSALDKPLNDTWVHRPDKFSSITKIQRNEAINAESIKNLLIHPDGGLKGIPSHAHRTLLLNQADNNEHLAAASRISKTLLEAYHSVLISRLDPPQESGVLPAGVLVVYEPIAGIILAAGKSSRMGALKQTLIWHGEALVKHAARIALDSGLKPVIVVTGYNADEVCSVLNDLPVTCIHNPAWADGQSSSVIAGINSLSEVIGGAIFLLADQPCIPVTLVHNLVESHTRTLGAITAPLIDGQRANPVLFDQAVFNELRSLKGDVGGRSIFSHHRINWLPWHDETPLIDIDSPEDYNRLLNSQQENSR